MSNLDFIVAKVRGMRSKLYEGERLHQLCTLSSLEDLADALAPNEPVGDAVALERHLTGRHLADLARLLPSLGGRHAELFRWMLRRYQLENLKVLLRCWATRAGEPTAAALSADLPEGFRLPAAAMLDAPDLEALIHLIPVRELRDGALRGLGDFEETRRLFFVETALDQAYFQVLHALAGQVRGPERQTVKTLVPVELDLYNALLVLRGLFHYSISFNKLRNLLAPFGRFVGADVLDAMRRESDAAAAVAAVPEPATGGEIPEPSVDGLETAMWRRLAHLAHVWYYRAVLDFGAVVAFYYIKRVELGNLIRITECIRYGERPEATRARLIDLRAQPAGVT